MSAEVLAAVGGREPLHFLLEMSSRLFSGLLLFISFFFQINCHLSLVAWPFLGFFSVLASPSPVTHLVSSDLILQPVFLFSLAWT